MVFDFGHLALSVLNGGLALLKFRVEILDFTLEALTEFFLVFIIHLTELLVAANFLLDGLVLLFDDVDFVVECVHIVVQRVVLLFTLAEGSNDLLVCRDSSLLLDLLKSVLDNLNITDVHVHQVLLLFVVQEPFLESDFQKSGRV